MKKLIWILIIMTVLITALTHCKKPAVENPPAEKPAPKQEDVVQPEENKKEEVKETNEEKDVPIKAEEKEDTGMFLGLDDSNFVVIFATSEKKDVHYKIDSSVNFDDIELGAAVKFRYVTSETDTKTITYIEAVETK